MSLASKLNRHLSGWRRGKPKPQSIVRTQPGPAKPRFIPPPTPPRPSDARGAAIWDDVFGRGETDQQYFESRRRELEQRQKRP